VSDLPLQIAGDGEAPERILSDSVRERLNAMYDKVPKVSCECDRLGQCCELTPEEMAADFAAMYPLFTVEYLNIVDYVNEHFDADRREALASSFEERPQRCHFLTDQGQCTIHPARPLVCRTYGVVDREMVEATAKEARGEVPSAWVRDFLFTERQTVCAHARPLEPEAKQEHATRMVTFEYERELVVLGRESEGLDEERIQALEKATGRREITRWSWGGFNALMRSPGDWFKDHFRRYWKASFLGD
jgi:Fe-S-cluster containining protein